VKTKRLPARRATESDTEAGAHARYAPAARLHQLKTILGATGGVTVYDIAERFGVSVRTAIRYVRALEVAGEPLTEETVGKRKVWRLHPNARRETISLTLQQIVTLFLSRRVFDFLTGTGFREDLDEIFAKLEATLRRRDYDTKNLERKLFDVNEAPHLYEGRIEHVDDIVTALLREERLEVTHGKNTFAFEPYTLLVYKKGLYLAGFSHHHRARRTFALDSLRDVRWLKGERFEYPADYQPAQLVEGNFGLFGGERVRVRLRFAADRARYVRRRQWHPTQVIEETPEGVVLQMDVAGTTELATWVMGWGAKVEVLEPEALRRDVAAELARAAARYASDGAR
jgi:predicted DNA-binding transcriptional regulator YafY